MSLCRSAHVETAVLLLPCTCAVNIPEDSSLELILVIEPGHPACSPTDQDGKHVTYACNACVACPTYSTSSRPPHDFLAALVAFISHISHISKNHSFPLPHSHLPQCLQMKWCLSLGSHDSCEVLNMVQAVAGWNAGEGVVARAGSKDHGVCQAHDEF